MTRVCGLNEYRVQLIKNGRALSLAGSRILTLNYSRVLDDVSAAGVTFFTPEGCCGQLGQVDHWNTDLLISYVNPLTGDDEELWRGPCLKPSYGKGTVTISAFDVLKWQQARVCPDDLTFTDEDLTDIAIAVWNSAVMSVDAPVSSIVSYPSGVKESRKVEKSSYRYAWNVTDEMLKSGLDVTTFGSQVIFGMPPFQPVTLTDKDLTGSDPVTVDKDGSVFANLVYAKASEDIVGQYPPGARAGSSTYPRNGYPLVEFVDSDSQITDQQSANNAAKARWDFSHNGVRRVRADGGLTLAPTDEPKINTKTVIAGQLINFAAKETCYEATETLRLGRLDVVVAAGTETATITLQPMGTNGDLDALSA